MRSLFACLAAAALAGPAAACINDIELPSHEREFRAQYAGPSEPPTTQPAAPEPSNSPLYLGGAVLLLGAIAVAARGPARV